MTSCSWSGGGDSTVTTINRQRESWTITALGHVKHVVRVIATEAVAVVTAQAHRARAHARGQQESRRCRCSRSREGCLPLRGGDPAGDELDHQHQGRERNRHGEKSGWRVKERSQL